MAMGLGCTARPGRSRENKTGSWRFFRPVFVHEKCTQCGMCTTVCPEGCVREDNEGLPVTDYDYCKGCGLCAEECPSEAIEMTKEEK
jgi:pyruvate ferredoxin oxidoreductase delta subunit